MDNTPTDSMIPYDEIVQEALRAVIGRVLRSVASEGSLPGTHHFYITFKTKAPGVSLPQHLVARFPDEMTIVLQHKYWDLIVDEDHFSVKLTFNQAPATLVIPYAAVSAFVDPSVDFALQFQVAHDDEATPIDPARNDGDDMPDGDTPDGTVADDGSNVVTVDFGRKK